MSQDSRERVSDQKNGEQKTVSDLADIQLGAVPQGGAPRITEHGGMTPNMTTKSPGEVPASEIHASESEQPFDVERAKEGSRGAGAQGVKVQGS